MISANLNTVPRAMSYNRFHKLLAYAANNAIMILDPYYKDNIIPKVLFSLKGHSERINSLEWLSTNSLVSVSSDKSLFIWSFEGSPKDPKSWTFKKHFKDAH